VTQPLRKRRIAMLGRVLRALLGPRRGGTWPEPSAANLPALHGRLEILRDARAVPHVYAEDERDAFAVLGFLQAADRFLILDVLRHLGAGRLCELLGDFALPRLVDGIGGRRVAEIDGFLRPLGFAAEAERDLQRLSPRGRACLEAFAEGVNAALAAMRGVFPVEYLALGRVRAWQPADALVTARASGFVVSLVNLENELTFDAVWGEAGDALARLLYPDAPWADAPKSYAAGVPAGTEPADLEPPFQIPGSGSNNWVVSAARSASGAPVLANDPHVPLFPLPTYWFHAHVETPSFRVQGGFFPGCPTTGFGHNGALAWGCTTGFRDAWDFFRVHRLPDDPSRYRTVDGSGAIRRHREEQRARFGRKVVFEWESCEHGVLLPGWHHHDGTPLALRFVPVDLARWLEGHLALFEATDVAAHRAALAGMNEGPFDFNHVYAHVDGSIGWELIGKLPRRAADGLFVRDAHDPVAQWQGFLDFGEMPKRRDPDEGFVASANSTVDRDRHREIASLVHFEPRYRQSRIETALSGRAPHAIQDSMALQADVGIDYGPPLRDALLELLRGEGGPADPADERSRETDRSRWDAALGLLADWDGGFPSIAPAPAIFFFTQRELLERCFVGLLGPRLGRRFAHGRRGLPRLHRLLLDREDPLRAELARAAGRGLADLAREAFAAALARLAASGGSDPARWRWGDHQRARLGTALAELPAIGRRFLALDVPFPGDDYTVSPSRSLELGGRLRAFVGASSRFVCDLARPDEAWFAHSSGPSGDAASDFFANLSAGWARFEYFRSALWQPHEVPDVVERFVHAPSTRR
jgi:penicillin amidase